MILIIFAEIPILSKIILATIWFLDDNNKDIFEGNMIS